MSVHHTQTSALRRRYVKILWGRTYVNVATVTIGNGENAKVSVFTPLTLNFELR